MVLVSDLRCQNSTLLVLGTFARLQPETSEFQKVAADSMEDVLVAALSKRSALSEGDLLDVELGDAVFRLRVQQLKPKPQISVIGKPILSYR